MIQIDVELIKRFHEKWEVSKDSECWEWTAAKMGNGYGFIKIPHTRDHISAHRLSYSIHKEAIPAGMMVCHTCDNPGCVNPSHLFLGTAKDNLQDMKRKGRHLFGERNNQSKLTDEKVRRIHCLLKEGISTAKIAAKLGVAQSTIWKIGKGHRWGHIYHEITDGLNVANLVEHK